MRDFTDTVPLKPVKRGPVQLTPEEAHELTRASWPARTGSNLRLVQPMAAEAWAEVDELPAADEYDMPRSPGSTAARWFWSIYLIGVLLLVCTLIAALLPA